MRIGLAFLEENRQNLTRAGLAQTAKAVEGAGFDGLWFFDAMGRGDILPDPLIGATLAASVTERIEVGTCILQVPLRRPVEVAHRILTAHTCSAKAASALASAQAQPRAISTLSASISTSAWRCWRKPCPLCKRSGGTRK